nr:MAG TPA: hypothetical protein [Caudoviricetes sp.]
MSLKTDYKDDIYSGKRRYRIIQNDDGTVSFDDVTDYTQDGDIYSAGDVNETNKAVNQNAGDIADIQKLRYATFKADDWSQSAPYIQRVVVPGMTVNDVPIISLHIADGTTSVDAKSQSKAYGYVDRAVSGGGQLVLYCYNSKPSVDFTVAIKGV